MIDGKSELNYRSGRYNLRSMPIRCRLPRVSFMGISLSILADVSVRPPSWTTASCRSWMRNVVPDVRLLKTIQSQTWFDLPRSSTTNVQNPSPLLIHSNEVSRDQTYMHAARAVDAKLDVTKGTSESTNMHHPRGLPVGDRNHCESALSTITIWWRANCALL